MRKAFSIILATLLVILFASCSKKPLYTSKYLDETVEDCEPGSVEWIDKLRYDTKSKIAVGVFNNGEELLIRVMANDQATIMKMFITGFTVWIDTTGEKEKHLGVNYPMAQGRKGMNKPDNSPREIPDIDEKTQQGEYIQKVKTALNSIHLSGFSQEAQNNAMLNTRDGDGITAWIEVAPGSKMYYELKIPLSELVEPENPEQNQISVGFESGKIEMPSSGGHASGFNPSMGMTSGGGRQGGGDGRSGGGGGGNPQHQQSMQAMSQPIDVWIKRIQLFY